MVQFCCNGVTGAMTARIGMSAIAGGLQTKAGGDRRISARPN
jgi:hypothetical protein